MAVKRSKLNKVTALASSFVLAMGPSLAVRADVVPIPGAGGLGTTVSAAGAALDVQSGTLRNGVALNAFSEFNVGAGTTVNLYQPNNATALVNVILSPGETPSTIAGTVNTRVGDPSAFSDGGRVFMVDPNGFVVSRTAVINAGQLTMSTATSDFARRVIAEGQGGATGSVAALLLGNEPLSTADIIVDGRINATRLDLRAGARMVLNGQINVIDSAASGRQSVANMADIQQAAGVSVEGGVLRFTAGSNPRTSGNNTSSIGGTIKAQRGTDGGTIVGFIGTEDAATDVTLTGTMDLKGSNAGSFLLFTEGSARMEQALRIEANATAGTGGFIYVRAKADGGSIDLATNAVTDPSIIARGSLATGGATGDGTTLLQGDLIAVTGALETRGGHLALVADQGIVLDRTGIETINLANSRGGDLLLSAPVIIAKRATIRTSVTNTLVGGVAALVARAESDSTAWNINPDNRQKALVRMEESTIRAGAVVITATAINANVVDTSASAEEAEISAYTTQQQGVEAQLTDFLDTIEGLVTDTLAGAVDTLKVSLPVQVQIMSADARVEITHSTIQTDAGWRGRTSEIATDFTGDKEARGVFSADGLLEGELSLFGGTAPERKVILPTSFDPLTDAIFIQSHAATQVEIAPKAFLLGVGVAVTQTDSRVVISGDTTRIEAHAAQSRPSSIKIRSTASENLDIAIAPSTVAGVSIGVIVAVHELRNQTLFKDGSIFAGDALDIAALTSKAHSLSVTANAGKDGKGAVALNIDIGNGITEAAASGSLQAVGAFALSAETLYFNKEHGTSSTLGLADPTKVAIANNPVVAGLSTKVQDVTSKLKETITGKKDDPKVQKPGFAFGLSFDLQIDDDDTYASLGGTYRDLANDRALVQLGQTRVTAAGGVAVNAGLRFATSAEGGSELSRSVDSSMGFLDRVAEQELKRLNEKLVAAGQPEVTKEQLFGQFGYAVFLNASVALMQGETLAEIGSAARITGTKDVSVEARTVYPEFGRFTDVRDDFLDFINEMSTFRLVEGSVDEGVTVSSPPELPDVLGYLDLSNYLTTYAGAYAEQNQLDDNKGESQSLAVAISVNVFNTDNETRAVVRPGALISSEDLLIDDSVLTVTAEQVGFFTHMQNFPTDIRTVTDPVGSNDNLKNLIGGAVTVARTKSIVEALVEGDATVVMDAVTLDAHNRAVVFNFVYAGGAAENIAINAAIGAQAVENRTVARLSDLSSVRTGVLRISALDDSIVIGIAGAFAGSDGSVSVGASGTVNFVKREVYAGIGPAQSGGTLGGMAAETRITADQLMISARNEALTIATAVAGSRVSGKPAPSTPEAGGTPPEESNEEDTLIPSWLFKQDESDALSAQNSKETPAGSDGSKQSSGWAVAGAATINLMLQNSTVAEVATNATITLAEDASVTAENLSRAITGAGAVSAGLGSTQKNSALAGAFAITVDERDVLALVRGVTLTARAVNIQALDRSLVVSVAVGGAGSSNGKVTLAGSFAASALLGETRTTVQDAVLRAETDLTVGAQDESLAVSVGGAVSINLSQSEGAGVGVGVAVNVVDRGVRTEVLGLTTLDAARVALSVDSKVRIYGFGVSVGVGKTGVAGSIAVNTITGGAKLTVGQSAQLVTIRAGEVLVTATEANEIWSLAGALTGGRTAAVGGALTANVIVTESGADLTNLLVTAQDLPTGWVDGDPVPVLTAVTVSAQASSQIATLAAAGAAATEGTAIGVGLSGNAIEARLSARLDDSVVEAEALELRAGNSRLIRSLGGGVAGSGKGAGGFAATVNVLNANGTTVSLRQSQLKLGAGGLTAAADANGEIATIAVALSASGNTSIGGAATVNIATGETTVSADQAQITTEGDISLTATDAQSIRSLSGGAALSAGGTGVGAALSANVITNRTGVTANDAVLRTTGGDIGLDALNEALIESLAVGLAASGGSTAVSGSVAIGYIGNETSASALNTELRAGLAATDSDPETRGNITVSAEKLSEIRILSGAAAGSTSTAVGGAVTIAVILDKVGADLATKGDVFGADLSATATGQARIDAIAVSAAVAGNTAVAPSLVYTQIGQSGTDTPSVPATSRTENTEEGTEDPAADGNREVTKARDNGLTALTARTGVSATLPSLGGTTSARLALGQGKIDVGGITVTATEQAGDATTPGIRSLAGSVAGGGTVGAGVGVALNLLLGKTEAILELDTATTVTTAQGAITVRAEQTGAIKTLGFAGGGGGTVGGAGSIVINILDRGTHARIKGVGASGAAPAILNTLGGSVDLTARQTGQVQTVAGAATASGVATVGGAFALIVQSDDVSAIIENIEINTALADAPATRPLSGAGDVTVLAEEIVVIDTVAAAASGAGKGAFAGSFAINIAEGTVTTTLRRATLRAATLDITSLADGQMLSASGVLAGSGFASVGLGVATNVSRKTVTTDLDSAVLRTDENIRLRSDARTLFSGYAMGGAVSGGISITGTAFANSAKNSVTTLIRDSSGTKASDVLARGSVSLSARSDASSRFGTSGDSDQLDGAFLPDANLNFTVGSAGIGAAVAVNDFANTAEVVVSGQSRIVGLGETELTAMIGATNTKFQGVAIDAYARSRSDSLTVAAAGGGTAVTGIFGFAILSDTARIRMGDSTTDGAALINVNVTDETGFSTPNAKQDTILSALTDSTIRTYNVAASISGSVSAGAAFGTNIAGSRAEILADFSSLQAKQNLSLTARSLSDVESWVISAAGGYYSIAGAVGVNLVTAAARVNLRGSTLLADGQVSIDSDVQTKLKTRVGSLGAADVALAGGIIVNVLESTSDINLSSLTWTPEGATAPEEVITSVYGDKGVAITAATGNQTDLAAVSAGIGLTGAVAIAGNVNVVKSATRVTIGAGSNIIAGDDTNVLRNLSIIALETTQMTGFGGSLAGAAGVGVGATLDVTSFAGTTSITVGDRAVLRATGGVLLSAKADRDVSSTVAALSAALGGSVSGAVSVVDMGGRAMTEGEKRDALLSDVQRVLGDGQSGQSGTDRGSAGEITSFAGGDATRQTVVAARQGVRVTGVPGTDQIGVILGNDILLSGNNGLILESEARVGVTQRVGSLALGGVGLSAAVASSTIEVASDVRIGRNVRLLSDNSIDLRAAVIGRNAGLAVDSQVIALAVASAGSLNAGVSVVRLNAKSRVTLGEGALVGGIRAQQAGVVRLIANRADQARAKVTGVSAATFVGIGAAVADAQSGGETSVTIGGTAGDTQINSFSLLVAVTDNSSVAADATGASGGIVSGSGSVATARNGGLSRVTITRLAADAGTIRLSNVSAAKADAKAFGVSVGGLAVGASAATSSMTSVVRTEIAGGRLSANSLLIETELRGNGGLNALARAESSSGALLAGNGADARAYLDYDIAATLQDVVVVAQDATIQTSAIQAAARAEATGRVFGLAAVGANLASSGQSAGKTASARTVIEGGLLLARRDITIATFNGASYAADVISGSGGLIAGAGGQTTVATRTETLTRIGAENRVTGMSAGLVDLSGRLDISASGNTTLASRIDNTSGALIGASGARATTTVDETVQTLVLGDVEMLAPQFDLRATTTVTRPAGDYTIKSASGGVVDVAAIVSTVTVHSATDLTLGDGVRVIQTGLAANPGEFLVGVATTMNLRDDLQLDAGGAVAVPVGDSTVTVARNDATLTLRRALLQGIGEVVLYNGGNADVLSSVNSNSYGLAGAATSLARATYNAQNRILIGADAVITSLGDVRLQAGNFRAGVQRVNVRAEARAYNKTAFPINVPPVADARADTTSRVQIDAGALITSVRDVYLLSEAGSRELVGYGRGKDLYRQVLAEIASAISQAFGGSPVSLDIETGSAVDRSDDGIIVNGRVRSGDRSQQVLIINERLVNGTREYFNDNLSEGYAVDLAKDITFTALLNQSPASELQTRIDVLNGYLANSALRQKNPDAIAAWEAERDTLLQRQARLGATRVDEVRVGPIVAAEGNIIMRADWVEGAATGELYAPGEAKVIIWVKNGAWLKTSDVEIVNREGGRISLNDVSVSSAEDLRRLSNFRSAPYALSVVADDQDTEPRIEIVTFTPDPLVGGIPRGDGTIILEGDVVNLRGEALVNSNEGSVDIRRDVSARTINISAQNDVIVGYVPGVRNIGGDPVGQYDSYFAQTQSAIRLLAMAFLGRQLTFDDGVNNGIFVPQFNLVQATTGLRAGRNVYVTADRLNINGLIQAGTGTFDVTLTAALEAELDRLRRVGGTGRRLLFDTAFPARQDFTPAAGIAANTNVKVYYNYETDQVEIADMFVRGGEVIITGKIVSTGAGRIEALDGFGRVNVVSEIMTDLVLKRIDLGAEADGSSGIEGLVRITDTDKSAGVVDGVSTPLVTEFRRVGSTMRVLDNLNGAQETQTIVIGTNDDGSDRTISVTRPTRLVAELTADNGRSATYLPRADQDMIIVTAEETTTTVARRREELIIIGITGRKTDRVINVNVSTVSTTQSLGIAPYIGASLPGPDYDYRVTVESALVSFHKGDEVMTHDSVRWWKFGSGWRHYEWTETTVTRQFYQHRLKADYEIPIFFNGSDAPQISIISRGDVIFSSTVLNQLGQTTVVSSAGSILTANTDVVLSTADTTLIAARDIRGVTGEFRMDQTAAGRLSLIAGNRIDLREIRGDMRLLQAETVSIPGSVSTAQTGTVRLVAQNNLLLEGTARVRGSNIELRAEDGSIGTEEKLFRIDTQGGHLTAYAGRNISIEELSGDLGLVEVRAMAGNVTLVANDGKILDRNNIERRDIRTLDELRRLWTDDLGLNGAKVAERRETEIKRIEAERTALYHRYWDERGTGSSARFTLDPDLQAALMRDTVLADGTIIPGWTQGQIDAYVAERQALYDQWNGETARDTTRVITLSPEEIAALEQPGGALEGLVWTDRELTLAIRSDLVRRTADTTIRQEDPNVIAAGNITLIAKGRVGEELPDYVIPRGAELSEDDLAVLFGAERDDIVAATDGSLRIRRAEDLNFQFTAISPEGNALGALRVLSEGSEIFLGAETPASLAEVAGQGRVTIRIDGNMTDASSGIPATVRGGILVLEAGRDGAIGTLAKPLTVAVAEGGNLTARAGRGVFITAPTGDMPLREVFSTGQVALRAMGAITDVVGADVPRVIGASILLSGGSIGRALSPLGVETTDRLGTLTLVTTAGDAFVKGHGAIRLDRARITGGGALTLADGMMLSLVGSETLVFGTDSRFALITPVGIDLTLSDRTDVSGGRLEVTTGGAYGRMGKRFETKIAELDYRSTDLPAPIVDPLVDTALWLRNSGDLRIDNLLMNLSRNAVIDVIVVGDLSLGLAQSIALARFTVARDMTEGRIIADRAEVLTLRDMGSSAARIDVTAASLQAEARGGSAFLRLRDRDMVVNYIRTGPGGGQVDVVAEQAALDVLAGGIFGARDVTLRIEDLLLRGDILSDSGNIDVLVKGDLTTLAGINIATQPGTLALAVTGDARIGDANRIITGNATDAALALRVDGTLSVGAQPHVLLQANAAGALTRMRLGTLRNTGPVGLRVDLDRLDASVAQGDIHLREESTITVEQIVTARGNIDLYTGGDTILKRASATGGTVVIGSGGALMGDAARVDGNLLKLFAFGGRLGGLTAAEAMRVDTSAGAEVWLLARDRLAFTETAGDLRVAAALSERGDLDLRVAAGRLTAGVLGAAGQMAIAAQDRVAINMIGMTGIDIADEVALRLVDDMPTRYGLYELSSPQVVLVQATGAGSVAEIGLANLRDRITILADTIIDSHIYDVTPADGLRLAVAGQDGTGAAMVDLHSIGDGPRIDLADPFADVRPLLANRLSAKIRPANKALSTATGALTIEMARVAGGQITHAGPTLIGQDIRVNGDVWFRQRGFDLLAGPRFAKLNTDADAQLLAVGFVQGRPVFGRLSFDLRNEIDLSTPNSFGLNRKLAGVGFNGGQGFVFSVGAESQIMVNSFLRGLRPAGVVVPLFDGPIDIGDQGEEEDEFAPNLPMVRASL